MTSSHVRALTWWHSSMKTMPGSSFRYSRRWRVWMLATWNFAQGVGVRPARYHAILSGKAELVERGAELAHQLPAMDECQHRRPETRRTLCNHARHCCFTTASR